MPIDAYVGKPGHGKSYGVVQHVIIPSLKQNRHVVTNIPLQVDMLLGDFGGFITQLPDDWYSRDDLADLAPPGCVLILDELWRRWPAGLKANNVLHQDKALLAEHRHRVDKNGKSMRIILVTQDLSQVASFARALIEQTYRVVKKTKKAYRVDIYSGSVSGDRPPKTQLQRQSFGTYSADVHRYYSSATQSETGEVGDESKADRRGNLFASPALWSLFLMVVLCLVGGIWGMVRYFNPVLHKEPVVAQPVVNPAPPGMEYLDAKPEPEASSKATRMAQTVTGQTFGAAPPPSPVWQVVGWLGCTTTTDDGSIKPCGASQTGSGTISRTSNVVLRSDGRGTRFVPMSACKWIERDRYVLCDIDGERVTPWTGRGAVTQTVDSVASSSSGQSAPARERSDRAGADARDASASASLVGASAQAGTVVTVVPDSEYPSRPWR